MTRLSFPVLIAALTVPGMAMASYNNAQFRAEVLEGLDLISARSNIEVIPNDAPGELGRDVYRTVDAMADVRDIKLFVPATMYLRAGAGLNLGFATDYAQVGNNHSDRYKSSGSYTTQFGLGWNLSSYVRTEIDLQNSVFKFHNLDSTRATYHTAGAMLYFDFARRYVQTGDITRIRHFVPYMGLGAGAGFYDFQGPAGADGFLIAAPRGALGFNVMLNDLIGVDVMYQYQMLIDHGFGWDVRNGGVTNISNVIASFRVNF